MNETATPQRQVAPYHGSAVPNYPVAFPTQASLADSISFSAYWHVLIKRRWVVLTVALIVTTVATVLAFRTTPVYLATARVEVEADMPALQSGSGMYLYQQGYVDDQYLETQIQILRSDALAWKTIEDLGLDDKDEASSGKVDQEQIRLGIISRFKNNLTVNLIPKTHMLAVNIESEDPRSAARIATTLVNNYVDHNFRQKYDTMRAASGRMEQQLNELKAKVEDSQRTLVEYERQHQIVVTGDKQNVINQMLSDASRDLAAATSDRIQKESQYRQMSSDPQQLISVAQAGVLQQLEEKSAELKGQYAEAIAQYGPAFPKAKRLEKQIQENGALIQQERTGLIERARNDYNAALGRERLAAAAVDNQKEELGKLNQRLVEHNLLQREFDTNQQLYQSLLQQLKDATVSAGLRSTNIRLVDKALPPMAPIRPKRLQYVFAGLFGGLMLGLLVAFAQEALDNSFRTSEEIEALLQIPSLGVLPLELEARTGVRNMLGRVRASGNTEEDSWLVARTISKRPNSALAEAYRSLRSAILFSVASTKLKTLVLTSARAGEGKTSTATNLAQALAEAKGPVLMMDCDLRKGGVARVLGLKNENGVSSFLRGDCELEECLQRTSPESNLWIMASGPVPSNPAELLGSDKMGLLLKELRLRYEYVIIDSPPLLAVTDAAVISRLVDGVLLVAESGVTPKGGLLRARRMLDNVGARIIGVALNKLDVRRQSYYGHYGYSYYAKDSVYPYGGDNPS